MHSNRILKPHTPYAHVLHKENENCGCYIGRGTPIICSHCGAAYEWETIITFPIWKCYDCDAQWWTSESNYLAYSSKTCEKFEDRKRK